jgi:hypothetical protein
LWYVGELEKAAAMEARYRATLEDTRRKTEQSRNHSGSSSPEVQKPNFTRPPPSESPVQKKLRSLPRLCSTGSWAASLKGTKMPRFFLTITGQLKALGLGEFQGQQHSGIDVRDQVCYHPSRSVLKSFIFAGHDEYRKSGHRASEKECTAGHQREAVPASEVQLDGKAWTGILESQDLVGIALLGVLYEPRLRLKRQT